MNTTVKCPHGRDARLCFDHLAVDDAAKRAYDGIATIATFTAYAVRTRQSPWVAIRLSDGSSDWTLYDNRRDCVRHQMHETQCAYYSFRNAPNGFSSVQHAAVFLAWHRVAYENGHRLPDPDHETGGPELIMPDMLEHLRNQFGRLN